MDFNVSRAKSSGLFTLGAVEQKMNHSITQAALCVDCHHSPKCLFKASKTLRLPMPCGYACARSWKGWQNMLHRLGFHGKLSS